jgi:ribose-phosphate pyrophosphokinase
VYQTEPPLLFTGNANRPLSEAIAGYLNAQLGKANVSTFSDGEINVEIGENVRGRDTFIIQSTCYPVNRNLMELLIITDALRRASAEQIVAVIPYYGYGRQDRKVAPRTPITSKLVADMLVAAGATRVVSIDLHAGQIQGFFNVPFDHLYAAPLFLQDLKTRFTEAPVVVSPDAGGTERARAYSKRLRTSMAIIDKRRSAPNECQVMNVIGSVEGQDAVLLDDIIDTAGTITQAAAALRDNGAKRVVAYCVHPVLSGPAIERIEQAPIEKVIVCDTIPLHEKSASCDKIQSLSVASLLGEAIRRIHMQDSVTSLFV